MADDNILDFNTLAECPENAQPTKRFLTLEDVLGTDVAALRAVPMGEFQTEKLGLVPFSGIDYAEYKQAKQDCVKFSTDGTGGVNTEVDDDKLMVRIIVLAVARDTRSNFSFANKALLDKLSEVGPDGTKREIRTAEAAVGALLSPGEVVHFAMAVQNLSGFGKQKAKENADAVKNS